MKSLLILILSVLTFVSCKKKTLSPDIFSTETIQLQTHSLQTYTVIKNTKYLVVFESGLGDDHSIWNKKNLPSSLSTNQDVLLYDRAGYGNSGKSDLPRTIATLSSELGSVIDQYSNKRKLILVGHSIAGMILRDYALKNPEKIAGIFLIDPSHEAYNQPTQEQEDLIYNQFLKAYGADFGATTEARQIVEYTQYMATLQNLPNVPVVVITSMKEDAAHDTSDKQKWFNAHELFKVGITDFTHIVTKKSGHYIFLDEPNLVLENLNLLISKLAKE